jgi:hypothetical protein
MGTPLLERWGWSPVQADLAALPDLRVYQDRGGAEARRFGVATSGHVLVYDVSGLLVFSGGITAARGHGGDNSGRASVFDRIKNAEGSRSGNPVFGCPLATTTPTGTTESRR